MPQSLGAKREQSCDKLAREAQIGLAQEQGELVGIVQPRAIDLAFEVKAFT